MKDENFPPSSFIPHPSSLWLAVQVYQRLGQLLPLPARIPQSLLEQLAQQTTPADQLAAAALADQTLELLAQLIEGRAAFPPWLAAGLPVERSQAVIQHAIRISQRVRMHYYAVSSDSLLWRTVEPYRLEQRGDTPYLVGFCHHAQAERTFRLDRIRDLELVDAD